jgi:arylformamidase
MPAPDYEAEFNARAQVPEHPAIFARWARDAALYRTGHGGAELDLSYGGSARQALDVFPASGPALALFLHGGWWRAMDRSYFSHMARGLNARGVSVAVAGYDLCPQVTIGEIVKQIRRACLHLAQRTGRRIVVYGHSAGGHLAAAMAATQPDIVAAGYAISGVFDLVPLLGVSMNADFRLDGETAHALSPLSWPAPSVPFDCVVGALESNEFRRQSRALGEHWGARYAEIAGANHFTVLDPLTDPDSAMVARLSGICARSIA